MCTENAKTRNKLELPKFPDLTFELELWQAGFQLVAGVDEAGRGALAGPVAAAVILLPVDPDLCRKLSGVRDSKMMSPQARQKWAGHVKEAALDYGVGFASNHEIDTIGIVPATHLAVQRALAQLQIVPEHLLTDYLSLEQVSIPQTPLVKGDARCLSIAGASILAKTSRDEVMCQMDAKYPGYGFCQHKGYGTLAHRLALQELGPSAMHRLSFRFKTVA
jgi:ribonuclease HII